jgi:EmrB/QacA subfamily drug resistance transporter
MALAIQPSPSRVTPFAPSPNPLPAAAIAASPVAVVLVVMLGNFLGPLYSSTANVILPNLVAAFGSDVDTMEWVVTGYMLGYSITMPLAGWLADTYGRKRMFVIGLAMFTGFSICASLAWNAPTLIAFRILQAVGGGIVSPTGMAIITDVIPPQQRGRALGMWGMGMMLAPAFGPWISGLLVDHFDNWRLIFWLGVPFGIVGLISALRILPSSEDAPHKDPAFDYLGFALLSSALTLFLIPLTQGNRVGWDDPLIAYAFIASALLFAGFVWQELHASAPMIDLKLFHDRVFAIAVGLRSVLGMGYYFSLFLLPLFTQTILGWDPTQSGLILMPAGLAMAVFMPIAGALADRIGPRVLVCTGMAIVAYGTFLFARIDVDWSMAHITLDNALRSAAMGILFTPLTAAALTNIPRNRVGSASGILNTVWQVGGSLGIAVGQAYLTAQSSNRYADVAAALSSSRIPVTTFLQRYAGIAALHHLPANAGTVYLSQLAMAIATVRAYGDTFLLGALLIALAVPLSLLLEKRRGEL